MNEQDVRTLLDDMAHTPPPPSRVDVQHAMTTARRRARARTLTSVAASILVVGVAAGVTYAVNNRPPADTGTGTPVTAATPAVPQAPQRFDPLVRYASFGWLPEEESLTWQNTAISSDSFSMNATKYVPDPANGPNAAQPATYVEVRVYAAGAVPLTEKPFDVLSPEGNKTVEYGPITEAPAVNGAPAFWVGAPYEPETVILKWRYAPDGWAEISAGKLTGDTRATIHRVASELRVGGTEKLRFPFHLTGLSGGLRPTASQLREGGPGGAWEASLDLNTQLDGTGVGLAMTVGPVNESESREPNTTVDGHPARRETVEGEHLGRPEYSDRLFIAGIDGLQAGIIIDATTAEAAAPLGQDGVLGVYHALTLLPDRANWTDQPVR